jgi:hypothetical protein
VSAETHVDENRERQGDVLGSYALERRIGLAGHQALERSVAAQTDAVIDVMLATAPKPIEPAPAPPRETVRPPKKAKKMPVGDDGTLDPFSR